MILVSGGSGLIGSHLLRELSKGDTPVRALYRSHASLDKCKKVFEAFGDESFFEKIEWFEADILDIPALEKAFQGISRVYHAAAVVSFKGKDQAQLFKVNIQGTANMVNLALKEGVQKFCFVSSVAAIGKYRDQKCSDEDALWQKHDDTSDYAISKFYAENEVWRASAEGLPVVIVNPSTVIGYGDWHSSSNKLFKKVHEGLPFYPPGSNGFVAVKDVVECMIKLMDSKIQDQRYILSAENLSYRKLFSSIAKGLSKKPPKYRLSKWQALTYLYFERCVALLGIKRSEISRANVRTAFSERCYKNEKVKEALGIKFLSIEETAEDCGILYSKFH
jgi:nucleoside-diphosphate-sugar epimerase